MSTSKTPYFDALAKETRKQNIPLSGLFELTPRCSLDCGMCYVHLTEKQMEGRRELTASEWIKIMDDAIDAGMLFPLLTGGECLMHKGFKDIYLHLKSKPVVVTLNTNATLLNDDYIKFFVENPPARIKITLYGMSEDGYERVTGHRVFSRVRDNILKLKQAGIHVKIAVTVSRYSYDEAGEVVRFARENGIEYMVDMAMFQAKEGTGRDVEDYGLLPEEIAEKYVEIRKIEGRPIYKNKPILTLPERDTSGRVAKSLRCGAGRGSFDILWTGMLQPCMWITDEPLNVVEMGFKEAWRRATEIAKEHIIPIECIGCKYAPVCAPCATMRADPNDPAHCNPMICKTTIAKINAGVIRRPADDV